jgi:hypothetical protein
MELSTEDREILAHVVEDPDAWLTHAVNTFGEEKAALCLANKVEKWKPVYEAEKVKPDYMNRVQRDAIEKEFRKAELAKMRAEGLIQAKMREQAITSLKAEGKIDESGNATE